MRLLVAKEFGFAEAPDSPDVSFRRSTSTTGRRAGHLEWNGNGRLHILHRKDSGDDAELWITQQVADNVSGRSSQRLKIPYVLVCINIPKPEPLDYEAILLEIDESDPESESSPQARVAKALKYQHSRIQARDIGREALCVWYRDDILALLHTQPEIRRLYVGFIAPDDALTHVEAAIGEPTVRDTAALVRSHTALELLSDQWVRLGQAGAEGDHQKLSLGPVAVDLEAETESANPEQTVRSARYIIERGDHLLRPSQRKGTGLRNIAVIGGPGQGKSTLGQLVCQAYRAALLGDDVEELLPAATRSVLRALHGDLRTAGLPLPRVRRWPIRVALHDFANHIAGGGDSSLLRYLALKVGRRLSGTLTDWHLEQWLGTWPWILVLDGLDEVASPDRREEVLTSVAEFLFHVRRMDADHLVLATTRPQGYRGEFHEGDFEPLRLVRLSPDSARQYAVRLAHARHRDDPDMRESVVERFVEASRQPNTARLMASPLQVTIMALLVEKRARMPQNRFELFDAYYSTIYAREIDKPGETGQLLSQYRGHIDWLHQHVGLVLQSRAPAGGELDSLMPESELRERSYARLLEETEEPTLANRLASELLKAATDRLVLLVSPEADHIGFEVRSLQEFMAAKALISGPEADILPRLQSLAADESWHNTWLLAAAGIFTHRPHLRDALLLSLRAADMQDSVAMALLPGARLAVDLVDDDLAAPHPRHHRLLVAHAADILQRPPRPTLRICADILGQAAARSSTSREILEQAVRKAISARDVRLVTGLRFLTYWALHPHRMIATQAEKLLDKSLDALRPDERAAVSLMTIRSKVPVPGLAEPVPTYGESRPLADVLAETLQRHLSAGQMPAELHLRHVLHLQICGVDLRSLNAAEPRPAYSPGLAEALAEAIDELPLSSWHLAMGLSDWLHAMVTMRSGNPEAPLVEGIS